MTIHLRIIHSHDRANATAPDNPMRNVPEVVRVWTPEPGVLGFIGTDPAVELNRAAKTGLIWHQDLLRNSGLSVGFALNEIKAARMQIQALVTRIDFAGHNPSTITLCSDWEQWSDDPVWDYGNWKAAVQDWPGPVGNFGNAQSHVPAMYQWPLASASCWASHGCGTTPSMFKDGILACKPRWRKANGVAIACITDPHFFAHLGDPTGAVLHKQYIAASQRADIIVHWGEGKPGVTVGPDYRKTQDRIIAANSGVK